MDGFEEEERLVQMVHDFIESSESQPPPSMFHHASNSTCHDHSKFFTLQEILGSMTKEESEILESVIKHMRVVNKHDQNITSSSSLKKWLVMRLKTDGFNVSLCQTSCVTSYGSLAGGYEYIEMIMEEDKHGSYKGNENDKTRRRLIVDIEFRSQFEVARPTTTYKTLTDMLPSIFIGTEDKLNKIISLLCSAAKQSLKERGLHLPPWRTSSYMHSKWLSSSKKVIA